MWVEIMVVIVAFVVIGYILHRMDEKAVDDSPYKDGYLDGLSGDTVKMENLSGTDINYARGFIVGMLVYLREEIERLK